MTRHMRHWPAPVRIGAGVLLCVGGLVGFLPILGFWMLPLGLLLLSYDLPPVRRLRRRLDVWWGRRGRFWAASVKARLLPWTARRKP
jgi:hypothetical protein